MYILYSRRITMRELRVQQGCQNCRHMSNKNRLVILRHGESEFNSNNLFCGWHDAPLTEAGVQQAKCIAAAVLNEAKVEVDKVYCSLLCRSKDTAEIILSEMKSTSVPLVKDWRLNERHYGNLTGFNKRQLANQYGEEQVQIWRRNFDGLPPPIEPSNKYYSQICNNPVLQGVPANLFPYSESMRMCVERIKPVWEDIKKEVLEGVRVMVIAHGTVARALVMLIESMSQEKVEKVNIPNSVPIVYEFNLDTGELIGGSTFLGDKEYIAKMMAKVASIGDLVPSN